MKELFLIPVAEAGVIRDAPKVASIFLNIANFLLSIIAIVGIIALIVSGVMYLTAYGDERKLASAKKIAIAAVVGLVIAFGALILSKTVVDILG